MGESGCGRTSASSTVGITECRCRLGACLLTFDPSTPLSPTLPTAPIRLRSPPPALTCSHVLLYYRRRPRYPHLPLEWDGEPDTFHASWNTFVCFLTSTEKHSLNTMTSQCFISHVGIQVRLVYPRAWLIAVYRVIHNRWKRNEIQFSPSGHTVQYFTVTLIWE